jgi:hypothetical protein
MAAYTHGSVTDEPCFASAFAADVGEIFAVTAHYDVRDKLLIRGIFFGLLAGHETQDRRIEEDGKIAIHIGCKAMEKAYLLNDLSLDDKYLLILCHGSYSFI